MLKKKKPQNLAARESARKDAANFDSRTTLNTSGIQEGGNGSMPQEIKGE
jgi:hypothetical protein